MVWTTRKVCRRNSIVPIQLSAVAGAELEASSQWSIGDDAAAESEETEESEEGECNR
jgi:hypothetical protein